MSNPPDPRHHLAANAKPVGSPLASLLDMPTDYAGSIKPEYFQQQIARWNFLRAVEEHAPNFLSTVQEEVFPAFENARAGETEGSEPMGWLEIDHRSRLPDTAQTFAPLREKILACATRFNLTVLPTLAKVLEKAVEMDLFDSENGEGAQDDPPEAFRDWHAAVAQRDRFERLINYIPRLFNAEKAMQEFLLRYAANAGPNMVVESDCDSDTSEEGPRQPEGKTVVPAAWACDVIAVTLWHWQRNPTAEPRFPFKSESPLFRYGNWLAAAEGRRYTADIPVRGPNPNESFAKFEGRILPEIRKQLRRDWTAARGRGAANPEKTADHHFEWFARFQVGGQAPYEISADHRDDGPTIQHSLRPTSQVLGLALRPAPKGRPKKRI